MFFAHKDFYLEISIFQPCNKVSLPKNNNLKRAKYEEVLMLKTNLFRKINSR